MTHEAQVVLLTTGPYAGTRWVVSNLGDHRIAGTGRRPGAWGRRPYYGHIERAGRKWRATIPGGHYFGTFATRRAAAEALITAGHKA